MVETVSVSDSDNDDNDTGVVDKGANNTVDYKEMTGSDDCDERCSLNCGVTTDEYNECNSG